MMDSVKVLSCKCDKFRIKIDVSVQKLDSMTPNHSKANISWQPLLLIWVYLPVKMVITIMFLSFQTDRSGQTVQTQIRWLLEEQSDQDLHSLAFCLHL